MFIVRVLVGVFAVVFALELVAAFFPRLLEDLEVPVSGSRRAPILVNVAPLILRPLEDLEVPVLGSMRARHFVPGAPVGPRPLEDLEVPV